MWNYTVNNIWQVTFQSLREVTKICPNKMKHGAFTQLKIAWGKGRGSRHQQTLHLALHQSVLRWDPSGIPPRVLPSWTAQRWWPDHPDGLCSAILLFQEAAVGKQSHFNEWSLCNCCRLRKGPLLPEGQISYTCLYIQMCRQKFLMSYCLAQIWMF